MNDEKGREGKMPGGLTAVELHEPTEEVQEIKRIPRMQKGCTNLGKVSKELMEILGRQVGKRGIDER